ncbi:MAG: hypothetical protein RMX96_35045 [Nostoc sp. ChiSLP02]|nr:hypothetical protein [Nostoc sp. DedSLP05]MDZ8101649.1 hypothetical protein [Nostoc sp. DedSLP01]MDZ8190040.1 hypothetical protein [Nostoc sp. ChiSLP02]
MRVIVRVVQKIYQEAHIDIPDLCCQDTIKQHIVDLYNSGEMTPNLNIFQVDFESISTTIVNNQDSFNVKEEAA